MSGELKFEKQLIERLTTGETCSPEEAELLFSHGKTAKSRLWEYLPHVKTTEQLWENFKNILEENNIDKLEGAALSPGEFAQVKQTLLSEMSTPYKAGQFLYGVNGTSQIEVDLDNGKHVFLEVFDQKQVGAGKTRYQVVNQIVRPPVQNGRGERRFDTTLLINGLPMIHIEEKSDTNDVKQALEQIHQYMEEGQFSDIYSSVQILVAMTPHSIRYMANTTSDKFNTDFAFKWQRMGKLGEANNNNITDWREFTDSFLSIPMAHRMCTNYMILDGTSGSEKLIVMRPYQVYATQQVIASIRKIGFGNGNQKVGTIWHTTGSGKTITSFKTAWIAKNLPQVDKVVFVVDRKSLTRQTVNKYRAYDPEFNPAEAGSNQDLNKLSSVFDSKNAHRLYQQLKKEDNKIVVTSTQKLMKLARDTDKYPKLHKHFLFIVDEAHRTTRGHSFAEIQKMYPASLFVGYTGTPVFERDAAGKTTYDIFGNLLHAYTIREAIADKNVLGFHVDFKTTFDANKLKEQALPDYYRKKHPDWTEEQINHECAKEIPDGLDDTLGASFYDENPEHVRLVVEDIFRNWKQRSNNGKYNALFTTHVNGNDCSTPMASMYYNEFKRVNKEREANGLFTLKVGMTYTLSKSNGSGMFLGNKGLHDAMMDYNEMFGTNYGDDSVEAYTEDLITRLDRSARDGKYLDLVIVVDQLLTGFDAPQLNTLYVDRTLKGKLLIQAYSRTNRVHNMVDKPYGRIINFRLPTLNEKEMNKALAMYSAVQYLEAEPGGDEDIPPEPPEDVLAPPFHEELEKGRDLKEKLRIITNNFQDIPASEAGREEMLDLMTQFSKQVAKLKQYDYELNPETGEMDGFDPDNPDALVDALGINPDDYIKLTNGLKNDLIDQVAQDRNVTPEEVELQMIYIKDARVNYDYLTELLNDYVNFVHKDKMEEAAAVEEAINEFTKTVDELSVANRIKRTVDAIKNKVFTIDPSEYPYKASDSKEIIDRATEASDKLICTNFCSKWGLEGIADAEHIQALISRHKYQQRSKVEKEEIAEISKQRGTYYQQIAAPDVASLSKMKFKNELREAYFKLADEIISNK